MALEAFKGLDDFTRGVFALDRRWRQIDVHAADAAAQDVQDVAQGRSGRRGHQANAARHARDGPLAFSLKETLLLELFAQFEEALHQVAEPGLADRLDDDLILAAMGVGRHAPPDLNLEPIPDPDELAAEGVAEADGVDRAVGVLEHKVAVAGGWGADVGDFTHNADLADLALQEPQDSAGEFTDRQRFLWLRPAGERQRVIFLGGVQIRLHR